MENLTLTAVTATLSIGLIGTFLGILFLPELRKAAKATRKAARAVIQRPFQSFAVVSLAIILVGVVKLAFLQG